MKQHEGLNTSYTAQGGLMTKERFVSLPRKDVKIIRDIFSEMISFDESEDHEEPHENVYRLETQLSILLDDTDSAHMCWEGDS